MTYSAPAAYNLALDGSGFVRIDLADTRITHTNDVSVRFKTMRPDGMVFVTSNRRNNGYLKLSLKNGRGVVETNIDQQRQVGHVMRSSFDHVVYTIICLFLLCNGTSAI